MEIKVIITGASGMVGEGVLLECLANRDVTQILMVNRKPSPLRHPKLKECIIPDFLKLEEFKAQLTGYNACFYCAGISSNGMNEADYTHITYDTVMHFATQLADLNPDMIFGHISGGHTDSTEKGRIMWARVKGKAENALMRLPFKKVYNFRPGLMKPIEGQKNIKGYYKVIVALYPVMNFIFGNNGITLHQLGEAMINSVLKGYATPILEAKDIKELAKKNKL